MKAASDTACSTRTRASVPDSAAVIRMTEEYSAHNYAPIAVVLAEGKGCWVKDVEGRKYLDLLAGYSAVSFGHSNPRLVQAAKRQLEKVTLVSRAFYNDQFGPFAKELAEFCGMDSILPMNSGAEGVETAIKTARKWAYEIKGVEKDRAEIITFKSNFHGRTTTVISFSTNPMAKEGFGPFAPGFVSVPYGDIAALEDAVTDKTAAVLIEPIQGEAGIIIPPEGYLRQVRELCTRRRTLMIADEVQTGLCRTGRLFACDHEGVKPDLYILGKALGGSIVPISAIAGRREVMDVFTPGIHGSTFGGNPFACAVAREVLRLIADERPEESSRTMGAYLLERLSRVKSRKIGAVRGRGLFIGIDVNPEYGTANEFCIKLLERGLLCKDTRKQTIRMAPPLCIKKEEIDYAIERFMEVFLD